MGVGGGSSIFMSNTKSRGFHNCGKKVSGERLVPIFVIDNIRPVVSSLSICGQNTKPELLECVYP